MRAAVKAERARATSQDQEPAEPSPGATAPAPADSGPPASAPADHGEPAPAAGQADYAARPEPPGPPGPAVEPERKAEPERKISPVKPGPAARPGPASAASIKGNPPSARAATSKTAARRRLVATGAIATALILLAAVSLGVAVARYIAAPAGRGDSVSPAEQRAEAAARHLAAGWITRQVSHAAVVSCDPLMCAALTADGFPSRNVRVLGPTAPYPLTSAVVVVTQAVRDLFGSSLSSDYAPAVLATFGSAEASITVRLIAPHGAATYWRQLDADLKARKATGADLARIPAITLSADARQQLLAGQPDSRLLLAIASLASSQRVDILDFGNIGPGADPAIPLRFADLAQSDPASRLSSSAYVRALRADLGAMEFRPTRIVTMTLRSGRVVLRIEFTAPSSLTLLAPQTSPSG
jgi:hypothetical protein